MQKYPLDPWLNPLVKLSLDKYPKFIGEETYFYFTQNYFKGNYLESRLEYLKFLYTKYDGGISTGKIRLQNLEMIKTTCNSLFYFLTKRNVENPKERENLQKFLEPVLKYSEKDLLRAYKDQVKYKGIPYLNAHE